MTPAVPLYARPEIVIGRLCTVVHLLRLSAGDAEAFLRKVRLLSAICQHTRPATPHAAGRHLDSSMPTSWDNGVWSVVLESCV
jgi:hypothetical protein